ncbi:MAG TPA: recombination mediator RecR [Myxococcota bacterium]|nr:recombination mediator RecR [Myxococcota bacterium]
MTGSPLVQALVRELSRLPGVGARSAQRLAHHLLRCPEDQARNLARAIEEARDRVHPCSRCGNYAEDELCPLCQDSRRDHGILLVVEKPSDIAAFETTGRYRGSYHVLGGLLSPLDGVGPDRLNIAALRSRLAEGLVREVVLAMPSSTEGDSTALYLQRLLPETVKASRLARGLPAGGELEYSDSLTVLQAFEGRVPA